MINLFNKFKGFIIDLDGVIYLDKKIIPHSKKFIEYLIKAEKKYIFLTNDSTLSPNEYSKILSEQGIPCSLNQIMTPITNLIEMINNKKIENKDIMVFSSSKLKDYLKSLEINIEENMDKFKRIKTIIVSGNLEFNYDDLMYASLCVQNGAKLLATSTDNTYPRRIGNVPATGSIIAAIQKTHPVPVINLGKPAKSIFALAKKKLNLRKQEILTVGDNLNTDILGSNLARIKSCLVLTGKTNLATAKKSKIKPDYVLNNLKI